MNIWNCTHIIFIYASSSTVESGGWLKKKGFFACGIKKYLEKGNKNNFKNQNEWHDDDSLIPSEKISF